MVSSGVGTKYDENTDPAADDMEATGGTELRRYTMWQDVHVMMYEIVCNDSSYLFLNFISCDISLINILFFFLHFAASLVLAF
jgi:hypothetical protein